MALIAGVVIMVSLDAVEEEVATVTRGDYVQVEEIISPETGCTVQLFIDAEQFSWIGEYNKSGTYLNLGDVINNVDHCNELLVAFPGKVRIDGGESVTREEFRPNEDGASQQVEYDIERQWLVDLGRRLLALLAGVLAGVLAALPWIAIFQVTRRLEEIRDRR
jgi:hypothetical protein